MLNELTVGIHTNSKLKKKNEMRKKYITSTVYVFPSAL